MTHEATSVKFACHHTDFDQVALNTVESKDNFGNNDRSTLKSVNDDGNHSNGRTFRANALTFRDDFV
jgi:hypothetical protein